MKTPTLTSRGVAGLAALALLAGVPVAASAQPYPSAVPPVGAYDGGYRYDACQRSLTNRGTGGALVGAGIGAVAGSNIAAGGNRTEGAVLGGLLGAVIGASVGRSSAACEPGTYQQGYQPDGYQSGYAEAPQGDPRDGYYGYQDDGYSQPGAYQDGYGDADGYRAQPVADGPGGDDCALAESPIYLPDGSVQKRFVRVCRDAQGRYQVVD
jgi:hypothetical protein